MKIAARVAVFWLILVSSFSGISSGSSYSLARDYTYYPRNAVNPLLNKPLYYNDAGNVLADLDTFQSLYIQYHSCAWSVSSKYDREENVCEDDKWYMGSIPLPLPNVAYTLYGVKKEQAASFLIRRKPGCHSGSYINSFFTTAGFTTFTGSLYAAGVDGFASYAGNNNNNKNNNNGALSEKCANGYGVACSVNHSFVYNQYADDKVCDADHFVAEVDELADLNTKLESAGCFEIYNADTASQYNNNKNGNGGGNNKNGQNNQINNPVELLLTYSESCRLNDPAGVCPNPHSILKHNEDQMKAAYSAEIASRDLRRLVASFALFGVAAIVLLSTMVTFCLEARQNITIREELLLVDGANKRRIRRRDSDDGTVMSSVSATMQSGQPAVVETFVPPSVPSSHRSFDTSRKTRTHKARNRSHYGRSNDAGELPRVDDENGVSDVGGKNKTRLSGSFGNQSRHDGFDDDEVEFTLVDDAFDETSEASGKRSTRSNRSHPMVDDVVNGASDASGKNTRSDRAFGNRSRRDALNNKEELPMLDDAVNRASDASGKNTSSDRAFNGKEKELLMVDDAVNGASNASGENTSSDRAFRNRSHRDALNDNEELPKVDDAVNGASNASGKNTSSDRAFLRRARRDVLNDKVDMPMVDDAVNGASDASGKNTRSNRAFLRRAQRDALKDKIKMPIVDDVVNGASDESGKNTRSDRAFRNRIRVLNDEAKLPIVDGALNVASHASNKTSRLDRLFRNRAHNDVLNDKAELPMVDDAMKGASDVSGKTSRLDRDFRNRARRDGLNVKAELPIVDDAVKGESDASGKTSHLDRDFRNRTRRDGLNDKSELPMVDEAVKGDSDSSGKTSRLDRAFRNRARRDALNDKQELSIVDDAVSGASDTNGDEFSRERIYSDRALAQTEPSTVGDDELTQTPSRDKLGRVGRGLMLSQNGSAPQRPVENLSSFKGSHLNAEMSPTPFNRKSQLNRGKDLQPVSLRSYRLTNYGENPNTTEEDYSSSKSRSQRGSGVSGPPAVRRKKAIVSLMPNADDETLDSLTDDSSEPVLPKAKTKIGKKNERSESAEQESVTERYVIDVSSLGQDGSSESMLTRAKTKDDKKMAALIKAQKRSESAARQRGTENDVIDVSALDQNGSSEPMLPEATTKVSTIMTALIKARKRSESTVRERGTERDVIDVSAFDEYDFEEVADDDSSKRIRRVSSFSDTFLNRKYG